MILAASLELRDPDLFFPSPFSESFNTLDEGFDGEVFVDEDLDDEDFDDDECFNVSLDERRLCGFLPPVFELFRRRLSLSVSLSESSLSLPSP